jgi:hypothetical protein
MFLESAALFIRSKAFLSISRRFPSAILRQLLCNSIVPCPPERSEGSGVSLHIISALVAAFGLGSFAVLRRTRDDGMGW